MNKRYYVAYGSNLNVAQMRYRCPNAKVIGTAWLEDYQLLFKGSKTGSYLTVEPKKGSRVPLGVWEVDERDELRLDRYEGYPDFYYKKELRLKIKGIVTDKVRERDCFIYIMHEDRPLGLPSTGYISVCSEGYRNFKFEQLYLMKAYAESYKEVHYENQ
ncbi:MAG: gamma-glutamylcyclotransferase [Clostridia bacterium]|nr:gamma-glutamylcyclotransferase [Clostridia bacterium]